jgi:hypothetical protein
MAARSFLGAGVRLAGLVGSPRHLPAAERCIYWANHTVVVAAPLGYFE